MRRRAALAAAAGLLGLPGCTSFEGPDSEADGDEPADGGDESDASGSIAVRVDGETVDLTRDAFGGDASGPIALDGADGWRLQADAPPTVADALDGLPGIGYERDGWRTVAIADETYEERTDGAETACFVNGALVDPEARQLQDGDELELLVATRGAADRDAPPGGVDASGSIGVTIDGEPFDLTRDRFQSENVDDEALAFHLHHGDGQWYSEGDEHVAVGEGLDLLPDVAYDREGGYHRLQLVDETYDERDAGTEIAVTVDGSLVDPTAYEVGDGDALGVLVATDS